MPGRAWVAASIAIASAFCSEPSASEPQSQGEAFPGIVLTRIASGLDRPVAITRAPGDARLFVTEQPGRIRIIDGSSVLPVPFLDISGLVSCCGERGLLSVAFHPSYQANGYFFVNYTERVGDTVVARYRVKAGNLDIADPASRDTILQIVQPFANHNGGQLQFGPDGYLYIGMGDGGSGGDPANRAQNLGDLLGKILRIDIDGPFPYAIPPSNPFLGNAKARREIWAYGLRNPWRFSFDRATGDLYIGDVGQNQWEEIDFQPASSPGGENYGWRLMEGDHCFNPSFECDNPSLVKPILEYPHTTGCSVTGGYAYRGRYASLRGIYFYADFCTGTVWGAARQSDGTWKNVITLDQNFQISSFGEDAAGEILVAAYNGSIYRIDIASPRRRPARR